MRFAVHAGCHVKVWPSPCTTQPQPGKGCRGTFERGEAMSPTTVTDKAHEKPSEKTTSDRPVEIPTREQLIAQLNEDLSREYQAVIAYVIYSQTLKGAAYMAVARELEQHAAQELSHAIAIAKQIDYLGGTPTAQPKPVRISDQPKEMLQFDLDNENETIRNYRVRIRQCEALGEYAMAEAIRKVLSQEQEHQIDLATALGIQVPAV
jgi:bacterioferritin